MEQFGSLDGFSCNLSIFRNIVEKIKVSLKSDKNNRPTRHFLSYLAEFLEREMLQTKVVEEIKTHFVFSNFLRNRAVYEIMGKNIVERCRPQLTTWRILIACWINKATHTHVKYLLLFH